MKLKTYRKNWALGYFTVCILFSLAVIYFSKIEPEYMFKAFMDLTIAIAVAGIIPTGLMYYALGSWMCESMPTTQEFRNKFIHKGDIVKNVFTILVVILLIISAVLIISPETFSTVVRAIFSVKS